MAQTTVPAPPPTFRQIWHDGPASLRWLVWCGVVAIIALYALPIQMAFDQAGVEATIQAENPDLDPGVLEFAWKGALVYAFGFHTLTAAVFVWLGWKVLKRRNWARIALSAFLVFATGASLISAFAGSMYLWAVIVGDGTHIVGLILLWVPSTTAYMKRGISPRPLPIARHDHHRDGLPTRAASGHH